MILRSRYLGLRVKVMTPPIRRRYTSNWISSVHDSSAVIAELLTRYWISSEISLVLAMCTYVKTRHGPGMRYGEARYRCNVIEIFQDDAS